MNNILFTDRLPECDAAIVDARVKELWPDKMPEKPCFELIASEGNKTLASVENIYGFLLEKGIDRKSHVLVIGGGITLDVGGFACSTFMRGISFSFAPTTLLAQVDASIGGKNGVNFRGYKNIVGSFTLPKSIYVDVEFLKTLPLKEIRNGIAESIKHGIISSKRLFNFLVENKLGVEKKDMAILEGLVRESQKVKVEIVERDFREGHERMKLNLGHTVGHALEKLLKISHGEAVAAGTCIESRMAVKMGLLREEEAREIAEAFALYSLPTKADVNAEEVLEAMMKDKKKVKENINLALPTAIGNVGIFKLKKEELLPLLEASLSC